MRWQFTQLRIAWVYSLSNPRGQEIFIGISFWIDRKLMIHCYSPLSNKPSGFSIPRKEIQTYNKQKIKRRSKRPYLAWQQKSRLSQHSILNVRASSNFSDIMGKGPGDKAVWRDRAAKMSLIFNIRELEQLRRRPQRRLQKTIGLMIKTTALHVHHAF